MRMKISYKFHVIARERLYVGCGHFLTILFFQLASAGQIMFVYSFLYPDNEF